MSAQTQISILLKGIDNASAPIKEAMDKIEGKLDTCQKASVKVEKSSKDMALAFNNVATSGMALYNAVDRVQTAEVALDKANLIVKTSANAVEDAQRKYNATIEKFGVGSKEATLASDDLKLAQERYQVACERAQLAQGNVNQAMMSAAVTVIPSLITMITSVSTLTDNWGKVTKLASSMLEGIGGPVTLAIIGIVALTSALILAYQKCEWFRKGVDSLATGLGNLKSETTAVDSKIDQLNASLGGNIFGKTQTAVEGLSEALKAGVGYNAQFAEAQRLATIYGQDFRAGLTDNTKIVDEFNAKVAEIPKTIEEQLVGKAQADLETFKNCTSGKFADISGDSTKAMQTLVADTNDLIAHGLVGQAQDNIKAFVDCSTNKQAKMVSDIDGYLKELSKSYTENFATIKQLTEWKFAATFTGQPGSDILAAIKIAGMQPPEAEAVIPAATARLIAITERLRIFLERGGMQEGGIVTRPTLTWVGEKGPEAIIPLNGGGFGNSITIQGPLLVVEGALDKRAADYAIARMKDMLQNVIVEPSSASASATHKRIRTR